ncbi:MULTISPECIES: bifunctional 5,10-methylenetetrahydrofolate dehydrogenase/5,10-methenyltetrahydrofolate cyclohydrolase [Pseudonocardia]|uniref:Bifunctional protein FolD n=2 Tax=Pseudonocardia TaxID=1847 RepID=A0A1Y2MUW4_PSEAH|nr:MULTISPECIES: bifunctional 5,10-methylenetetrahydrofolate dehydrogenase/5,10-methenyltetrahydrofolate cyclohydrolase [Pseudonocardia]OSY38976.1 Bifunctional protein FolD protein [Pseudonocardia autotrophica]TDN76232.1 methenyltetrahydrofolate cyclohydrolase /5,10-methylenetetrahydrofolate dehydrogenase (NADP+) [Pseudonocardia autotrophica]BBG00214.1 bifunctional protein FolD [Pseudonocardia autotrophica]GEC26717.1 bifunctional protein FolD [Pseudonocardia saturnea]
MSTADTADTGSAVVLDGTGLARSIRERVAAGAAELIGVGVAPRLAVVVATDDEGAGWYVRSLSGAARRVGIACDVVELGADADPETIRHTLLRLSGDDTVHGIILQTPLPDGVRVEDLAADIAAEKDVDGANPLSAGRLAAGLPAYPPATAAAVLDLLDHHGIALAGRSAVVVGRSLVVGKPTAQLLLQRDATVSICHRHTKDLAQHTREADVLVVAVGRIGLVRAEHVAPGAIVVDVGTNTAPDGSLAGDVDGGVAAVAGGLTPVPGGVGPVTTALLLEHTVRSARSHG